MVDAGQFNRPNVPDRSWTTFVDALAAVVGHIDRTPESQSTEGFLKRLEVRNSFGIVSRKLSDSEATEGQKLYQGFARAVRAYQLGLP